MKKSPSLLILIFCLACMLLAFFTSGDDLFSPRYTGNDIEDFLLDLRPFILFGSIGVSILVIPLFIHSSKNDKKYLGENSTDPYEEKFVTAIRKRVESPYGTMSTFYFILFEDEYCSRIELAIKNLDEYNLILEGDKGILCHRGKRFISFIRDGELDETEEENEIEKPVEKAKTYCCPKCDNIIKHGSNFCSNCGAAFDWDKK